MLRAQMALLAAILAFSTGASHAQTGIWMGVGPVPHAGTIKDAPFSADLVSTNDQVSGTPGIKTEFHGKVARDSQGDSYFAMEHMMPVSEAPRPVRITITNPSASTITTLDPQSKTAFVSHVPSSMLGAAPTLTPGASGATPEGQPAGAVQSADPGTKIEPLGSKEVNGLRVVGVRTTHTVPPSTPDAKPFVSTVETWRSADLNVIVSMQMQTSNGDRHLTKLENIVRSSPSAELFRIPGGYSVRENAPLANNIQ